MSFLKKEKIYNINSKLVFLLSHLTNINVRKLIELPARINNVVVGKNKVSQCIQSTLQEVTEMDFNGITTIANGAFMACRLTSVTIPDNIITIGNSAFSACDKLTSVTIPNSVTSIGKKAFYLCSSLTDITIPNSVTTIEEQVFYDCNNLTNITIPNSVTTIGNSAFYDCNNLTNITIPNSVTRIGEHAFSYCNSLTNITIPNSVTRIDEYAFSSCNSLTSITIPNSVTGIGDRAFLYCPVKTIYASDIESWLNINFTNKDSNPIRSDSELYFNGVLATDITIPNSITTIKSYAFYGYSGLTSITIPNSVTKIMYDAFYDCDNLKHIYIKSATPPALINPNAISTYTTTIHVPRGSGNTYKTATNWSSFADKIIDNIVI